MVTGRIQVDGKELDVEMEGKTKADGKVGLEGSIQQGKEKVGIDFQCSSVLDAHLPPATRTVTLQGWSWWRRMRTRSSCATFLPNPPGRRKTPAVTPMNHLPAICN